MHNIWRSSPTAVRSSTNTLVDYCRGKLTTGLLVLDARMEGIALTWRRGWELGLLRCALRSIALGSSLILYLAQIKPL